MTNPALPESNESGEQDLGPAQMPSSQPLLIRALRWGVLLTILLILSFAVIGWFVSGQEGLIGGVLGAALGGMLLLVTVGSIAFANRYIHSPSYIAVFFGIVLGSWVLKFVAFLVAALLLRDQVWLDSRVMFFGVTAGIVSSLILDVIIVTRARIPITNNTN